MSQLRVLGVLLLSALASAQVPHLYPRILLPGEAVGSSFWLMSPVIAVVKVQHAAWLGPEIEISPPKQTVVRLVRVDAEIENVIQGGLSKGHVQFYFFTNTPSSHCCKTVLYWLEPGGRYVVFLREDGDVLRTMSDVDEPTVRILSGLHDRIEVPGADPRRHDPGRVILNAALAPTPDYEKGFAQGLEHTYSVTAPFVGPADSARLLRNLLTHPDASIRAQACLTLARHFRYRDPCLPELLSSQDVAIQGQANLWMRGRRESTDELVRALKENPISLSVSEKLAYLPGELELFTLDWDSEVRHQACETLHRLFPSRRFQGCTLAN
jgi:hypothetical protein